MLTVKHITSNDESIRQAMEVRAANEPIPEHLKATSAVEFRQVVYADLEGGSTAQFSGGTVYVMNDNGATVAKYDLGGLNGPSA